MWLSSSIFLYIHVFIDAVMKFHGFVKVNVFPIKSTPFPTFAYNKYNLGVHYRFVFSVFD